MNDDFIYRAMPEPRAEFSAALWLGIAGREARTTRDMWKLALLSAKKAGWRLAVLSLVIVGMSLLSIPSVRAAALQAIMSIAGFDFHESTVYPYEEVISYNEVYVDVEEARAKLPFSFGLPTWIPEGYVPSGKALVLLSADESDLSKATNIYLYWEDGSGNRLFLIVQAPELAECSTCVIPIGADSTVEVVIHGSPAALTRGAWDPELEAWDTSQGTINLRWISEDAIYMLTAVESSVSEADLIRVAESIR